MSTQQLYERLRKHPITVETPRGLARVTSAGTNCHGVDFVRVRMAGTGSPWTFERRQVRVVR